jgi:diphthamide biosynthesis enzyme Dph1/Dph2-like protein
MITNGSTPTMQQTSSSKDIRSLIKSKYTHYSQIRDVWGNMGQPYLKSSSSISNEVRRVISKSSKKAYQIKLGQITAEKLGNYSFVDIFILIDCQLSFPLGKPVINKPIVSPYELINALSDTEWQPMILLNNDDIEICSVPVIPVGGTKKEDGQLVVKLPE